MVHDLLVFCCKLDVDKLFYSCLHFFGMLCELASVFMFILFLGMLV